MINNHIQISEINMKVAQTRKLPRKFTNWKSSGSASNVFKFGKSNINLL